MKRYPSQYISVVCPICKKERIISRSNTYKQSFTGICSICNNKKEITSRRKVRGYIKLRLSPNHPYYDIMGSKPDVRGRRYVYEHRLIMAEYLGRPLIDNEVVHHKNEIRDDNRIENLELFVSDSEHQKRLYIELQSLRARVSDLETRNTQLEAEVALLRAQLEKTMEALRFRILPYPKREDFNEPKKLKRFNARLRREV